MAVGGGGVEALFYRGPITAGDAAEWLAPGVLADAGSPAGGMSIGGAVTGGTQGSVLFIGAGGVLAQDNANFFWDDSSFILKIASELDFRGTTATIKVNGVDVLDYGVLNGSWTFPTGSIVIDPQTGTAPAQINLYARNGGAQQVTSFGTDHNGNFFFTPVAGGQTIFSGFLMNCPRVLSSVNGTTNVAFHMMNDETTTNFGSMNQISPNIWSLGYSTDLATIAGSALIWDSTNGITGPSNIIEQRSSTSAQSFHLYNTFTNASNYERSIFDWQTTANVLTIGTQAAGTGTVRNFQIQLGGTTFFDIGVTTPGTATFALDTMALSGSNDVTYKLGTSGAGHYAGFNLYDSGGNLSGSCQIGNSGVGLFASAMFMGSRQTGWPFYLVSGGVSVRVIIDPVGSVVIGNGSSALATNATDGFLYIPTCAGTPTGVPTAHTGTVPMIYDTTNNKFYIYNGAWKGGTNPGAFT